eukprot:4469855-Amphidinium_carterae.1
MERCGTHWPLHPDLVRVATVLRLTLGTTDSTLLSRSRHCGQTTRVREVAVYDTYTPICLHSESKD